MKNNRNINRRSFLKVFGAGAAVSAAAFAGCTSRKPESSEGTAKGEVPTDRMTYRTGPVTGEKVSLLGYGCMRLPRRPKTNGEDGDEIDQQTVNELTDYALAHGINYFDTSPVYCQGLSERAMGIALNRHSRESYLLATKMSNMHTFDRESSLRMYEDSFKELQTDYFDYYLVHAVGNYEKYKARYLDNGILDFLLKEREAGRIRNLGWSFHGEKEFFDYMMYESGVKWDFVQIQLNYFDWKHASGNNVPAEYLYGVLEKLNVPAIIMEPLLGGRLANPNYKAQEMLKTAAPGASSASWAFRFAGTPRGVLTVLSGMTYMEHLQDNIRTLSPLVPLDDNEKMMLERVALTMLEFENIKCTACQYCMPCPYGLDIPSIFAHYNKCLDEGSFPVGMQDEEYRKARRNFLIGYDRKVPRMRQASHCIGCGLCVQSCPQYIQIPEEMRKIDRFVEELKTNA